MRHFSVIEDYADPRSDIALFNAHEAGYGYQWWTLDDGAFMARGIFGQGIFIDPERRLVIASNGSWPQASGRQGGDQSEKRLAFYRQVQLVIDKESAP